jgi:hypothetical protein
MDVQIEWSSIAKVKYTLLIATFESVRRLSWQTYVGWRVHLLPRAIRCDVGERPLELDVQLIAGMAVIGHHVFGGRSQ